MSRVPANKGMQYEQDVLSMSEVSALMSACNGGLTGARNRALIAVMYRSGLRVSEALNLKVGDLRDVEHNGESMSAIKVRKGKGGKSRVVGIDDGAMKVIKEWMSKRGGEGVGPGGFTREAFIKAGYVFCSLEGNRLDSSYVRKMLPRLAMKAGIHRRVHPHMLRHSHAFELAMESVPIHIVQRQLGHSSLKSTQVYVSHLGDGHVLSALASREAFAG